LTAATPHPALFFFQWGSVTLLQTKKNKKTIAIWTPDSHRASPAAEPPAYVSIRQHTSACVSMRQHASACVSMRQHASACVSIRQHTSAYVWTPDSLLYSSVSPRPEGVRHTSACVSIRCQHTLTAYVFTYVSMRQHTLRQHTLTYVSMRQHTLPAYVFTAA
jgi:hypothetical protein